VLLVFASLTCIAYLPAFSAGFIWDDPDYVVNNANLRDASGLARIWFEPRTSPQYYPLVFTTFWIEYQLWGDWAPGYHGVNILLHAIGGWMLFRVLDRLGLRFALIAALIWTLHPVQVESVAWITERKNTLSALCYLTCAWMWLDPRNRNGNGRWTGVQRYWLVLLLFVMALLSKSVTASLPAALLLVGWWKHRMIDWREVKALIPLIVIGVALGLHTSHLERVHVGAVGPEWDYAESMGGELAERTVIAGRAVWFYVGSVLYPANLAFMYERWEINRLDWVQWIAPVLVVVMLLVLVILRRRHEARSMLVCLLFFGGTVLPAIGFFNVYPHRYSFVADHFQHLASIGIVVLGVAVLDRLMRSTARLNITAGVLLVPLMMLTFVQSREYESKLTLWEATAERSPRAWIAWTNLGKTYADLGRMDEAITAHEVAHSLNPNVADTRFNLAMVRARQGQFAEAKGLLLGALDLTTPRSVLRFDAMIRLAWIEEENGNLDEARGWFARVLSEAPDYPPAQSAARAFLRTHGDGTNARSTSENDGSNQSNPSIRVNQTN
jgi:hypothetical protein